MIRIYLSISRYLTDYIYVYALSKPVAITNTRVYIENVPAGCALESLELPHTPAYSDLHTTTISKEVDQWRYPTEH